MRKRMERSFFSRLLHQTDVGIDLGTYHIRVYVKNRGIVLREPSVVAFDDRQGKAVAIGAKAAAMADKDSPHIRVIRPLVNGVIAEFDGAQALLEAALTRVVGRNLFFKPRVMLCVPTDATGVERRAVTEAAMQAGASKAYLLEEPLAAALGAGLAVQKPLGCLVVTLGAETTEAAVLSMGQLVSSASLRLGGQAFNQSLSRYMKNHLNIQVDDALTEEIKLEIGTVNPASARGNLIVKGRDMITGLPTSLRLDSRDTARGMQEALDMVLSCIHRALEKIPPELAADVLAQGMVLTGGGAQLDGLAQVLGDQLRMPVRVAERPEDCVAIGTGRALDEELTFQE